MIKKLSLALIIAIIFTAIPVFSVEVNAVTEETITAPSAVLMETSSGKILFEKNPHEQRVKMPFIMKQSQNRSVQGSGCGADGDDGNTAQYIQKIQDHQIGQGTQNMENAGFNKTVHDGSF